MTSRLSIPSVIFNEDHNTRNWMHQQVMPVAWNCFRISALYGTAAGIIASLIVHKMAPGIPLTKHLLIVCIPVLIGSTFLINGAASRYIRRRWELTPKGIKIRGKHRFTISWKRLGRIESRPVPDLSGYTEIRAFVGTNPVSTRIVLSLPEKELRSNFESMHPQVLWISAE